MSRQRRTMWSISVIFTLGVMVSVDSKYVAVAIT